jgi:outer membrane protein insertion porin family/translocation and assembly module TamA
VIGYHEITTSFGASRNFFGRLLYTSLSFNWQANFPFLYQGSDNNTDLIEVQVTYPELITDIDLRDDPLQPTSGVYFSNSLQVALPIHKQDPTDVRIHPEVRTFVPLDNRHRLVLATRVGVGMVFPQNYGDALASANTSIDTTNDEVTRDQQRLVFRAFYSGGPSSNRGYPYRRVGPQGAIGFLLPANVDCNGPVNEIDASCIRPLGGFTMWEASTELRFHAFEKWNFVGFIDASDVSTHVASITFLKPHISIGPGVRYLSPVGPIRVDVGWRVPGLQKFANVPSEPPDVSDVPPYYDPNRNTAATWDNQPWWQRFTLNILIGEDF